MTIIENMCTQLFSCPLCAQPSFDSLDSLRIGLVSVATRPLVCPICNDTLLGIDKLTIHLFGHTIAAIDSKTQSFDSKDSKTPSIHNNNNNNDNNNHNNHNNASSKPLILPQWSSFNDVQHAEENEQLIKISVINRQKTADKSASSVSLGNEPSTMLNLERPQKSSQNDGINGSYIAMPIIFDGISGENAENAGESGSDPWKNDLSAEIPKNRICADEFKREMRLELVSTQLQSSENAVSSSSLNLHIPEACNSVSRFSDDNACNKNARNQKNSGGLRGSKCSDAEGVKGKTERCNICGFNLPNRELLILHKQLVHLIAAKDFNVRPEDLLKNYPCHLCTKVFKMRGSLMVHMRVAHTGGNLANLSGDKSGDKNPKEGGFNCPLCGKNFKKEQHVTQHLKTHEGKQWECDVCTKMFTTKYFLKKHKRLHSGEMPYKCSICDKTFTFQQSYHKHRLYHKDDKPHTCTVCGKSFKELSTLHNHERIHTGEKPFACETCGKCFRQRVSYLVHRRIHTGVMPYTCIACGKSFRYKVSQRTHKCIGQLNSLESQIRSANNHLDDERNSENRINPIVSSPLDQANKFVLIVDNNGKTTLTREIDMNIADSVNEKTGIMSTTDEKSLPECESIVNLRDNNSQDFFSLVMSPLPNELSSPSAEMQHLTLSSPKNSDNYTESIQKFQDPTDNLQKDLKHAIDDILSERNRENTSLETINEESLKELLYGINKNL